MIPERRRAQLPPGHWYLVHQPRHGRLVVTVSTLVPPDSPLEQELVRVAVKAWKQHQRRGLVLLPAPIAGGASFGWLMRQLRRPTVAVGAAVATVGVALAVMPIVVPHTPTEQLMPRAAPSARLTAPTPGRGTAPHRPAKAPPKAPAPRRPAVSHPVAAVAVSTSHLHVDPARLPVRLPVRIPPVHMRPPRIPVPPVSVPPVSAPATATRCRLVTLELKVTRVCL